METTTTTGDRRSRDTMCICKHHRRGGTIGNNVIIGVGSVIVSDIPDNSIAVGNPCRVIKTINQ